MKYMGVIYSILMAVLFAGLSIYLALVNGGIFFPLLILFASYIHAKAAEHKYKVVNGIIDESEESLD